jgi:hypothetical protein
MTDASRRELKVGDLVVIGGKCETVNEFLVLFTSNEKRMFGRMLSACHNYVSWMFGMIGVVTGICTIGNFDLQVQLPNRNMSDVFYDELFSEPEVRLVTENEEFLYHIRGPRALIDG